MRFRAGGPDHVNPITPPPSCQTARATTVATLPTFHAIARTHGTRLLLRRTVVLVPAVVVVVVVVVVAVAVVVVVVVVAQLVAPAAAVAASRRGTSRRVRARSRCPRARSP